MEVAKLGLIFCIIVVIIWLKYPLYLAMTAGIRETLAKDPALFDPRGYLKVGRENIKTLVKNKIVNVLGSNDKV